MYMIITKSSKIHFLFSHPNHQHLVCIHQNLFLFYHKYNIYANKQKLTYIFPSIKLVHQYSDTLFKT